MFRIYFESGIAKILGHDPEWRNFTAMDQYYQNGPLPTWIAWYVHQLPHWFHAATAFLTLALELVLIFAIFLPRRSRIVFFFVLTAWQTGIILTSNYAFLNYIVLVLGFLLLDDQFLDRFFAATSAACRAFAPHVGDCRRRNAKLAESASSVGASDFSDVDFLCDLGAAHLHVVSGGASAHGPGSRAGTVSLCQRIRALRRHDPGAVRN